MVSTEASTPQTAIEADAETPPQWKIGIDDSFALPKDKIDFDSNTHRTVKERVVPS